MVSLSMVTWIILGSIVIVLLWGIMIYNKLVKYRQQVSEGWSGIDVQLKRRANLIPNLVETVKGYASHEKTTLQDVVDSRSKCLSASGGNAVERGQAEGLLSNALTNLLAVVENYPDLKANNSFLSLQHSLSEIEDQIQMARRYYNGTVRIKNIAVESFPSNVVALKFQFIKAEYFQIEDPKDRVVPGVKL